MNNFGGKFRIAVSTMICLGAMCGSLLADGIVIDTPLGSPPPGFSSGFAPGAVDVHGAVAFTARTGTKSDAATVVAVKCTAAGVPIVGAGASSFTLTDPVWDYIPFIQQAKRNWKVTFTFPAQPAGTTTYWKITATPTAGGAPNQAVTVPAELPDVTWIRIVS